MPCTHTRISFISSLNQLDLSACTLKTFLWSESRHKRLKIAAAADTADVQPPHRQRPAGTTSPLVSGGPVSVREAFPRRPFLRFDLIVSWISSSRLRATNMETSMLKNKKKLYSAALSARRYTQYVGKGGQVVLSSSISLKEDLPQARRPREDDVMAAIDAA